MGGRDQKWIRPFWLWNSKLTVSKEWRDGIKWLFGCWYKFRKAKCWFNDFLVRHGKSGQKWAWAFSSWNLIICCISRMSLWIEVIFCMLKVMHYLMLVRLISYSLSSTFECWGSVAVVLVVIVVIIMLLYHNYQLMLLYHHYH